MLSAYKKQYGSAEDVDVVFNRENNTVMFVSKKLVVNKPLNTAEEISYKEAVKIRPDVSLGDNIRVEENPFESFGRIAAQTAKQVIIQKIKESEKNIVYNDFKDREGDLINGYLQRKSKDVMYVDLGKTEGILPAREQSPLEHYKPGDRVKALILKVDKTSKTPGIILSRANPKFIEKLFEMEIPEIYDGIVRIVKIVREAGLRTKVAVTSERDDVDSVGACVGMRGIRIQSIVRELEGEKIDVVEWSDEKKVMVANALVPAKAKEIIEKADGSVLVIVENDHYSFAVGKSGHNVRLASRLCGFDIDIKSEEQYREFLNTNESRAVLEQLFSNDNDDETPLDVLKDRINDKTIKLLETGGIFSVEDLVEKSFDDLIKIDGIGEKTARKILDVLADAVDFDEYSDDEETGE
ncbi:MAG: transcription termination factor NusA, partial [Leptospirales bacterium]|nr:transcription termination factor NusA [Leptospirales bacterium]